MHRAPCRRIGSLTWALLACLWGCHPGPSSPRSKFTRVVTPHFTVYSDVSRRSAEAHARKLEWLLQGLLENGWEHHGELRLKLNVVLLRHPTEVKEFAGPDFAGYFHSEVLFEPWALLAAPRMAGELPMLVHELSHHLAYLALQNQPTWFAEGLATYYESATIEADGRFVLGAPTRARHDVLDREGILPAAKLFAWDRELTPRSYASAWLLVHYLMSRRPDAFVRYQDLLAHGNSHALAWTLAFPDLRDEALDRTLHAYYRQRSYDVVEANFEPSPVSVQSRALGHADEEALWALLWHGCRRCSAEEREQKAREHARRALDLDPRQVDARLLSALLTRDGREREALLRALTRDEEHDYRGWLGLASLQDGPEARAAVETAVALAPEQPAAWMAQARYQWSIGEHAAALESAERGLRLRPTNLPLLAVYAELLFRSGRCSEANAVMRRASSVESGSLASEHVLRLHELSKTCGSVTAR